MNVRGEENHDKIGMQFFGTDIDKVVFIGSTALVLPFIVLGAFFPDVFSNAGKVALAWITETWGWLYLSSVNMFVAVCLLLALSPWGAIRLGKDGEKPEFSRISWFSMLFSAGMGIGLVFWSIAEPLYHFAGPPVGTAENETSARLAFAIFFHHWGLHAWGTYVAVGLPMAYFQFRKGAGGTISSCLTPFFKKKQFANSTELSTGSAFTANLVDMLAIWATVLGVVTSLGLGALQITSGLSITFGVGEGYGTTAVVILVITLLFVASALSGVKKGIRFLSLTNVVLMFVLLGFFLVCGPFKYLIGVFTQATVDYLTNIIPFSTTFALFDNSDWTKGWTIFYWAWWIAWAPFVGAFIASISRGRTIREFVLVVMLVPALFSFLFSSALGGTAIYLQLYNAIPLTEAVTQSIEGTLFETLRHLPMYGVTALLANLLIGSFFITSADSATFVICRFSTGRHTKSTDNSSKLQIIFWGMVLGGLALILIKSGGLKALQTASIVGALPFVVVMYFLLASLARELLAEKRIEVDCYSRQSSN